MPDAAPLGPERGLLGQPLRAAPPLPAARLAAGPVGQGDLPAEIVDQQLGELVVGEDLLAPQADSGRPQPYPLRSRVLRTVH